jgi:hypothetical protein
MDQFIRLYVHNSFYFFIFIKLYLNCDSSNLITV